MPLLLIKELVSQQGKYNHGLMHMELVGVSIQPTTENQPAHEEGQSLVKTQLWWQLKETSRKDGDIDIEEHSICFESETIIWWNLVP